MVYQYQKRAENTDSDQQEYRMNINQLILAIALIPVVIASSIAVMALSYLLVPVMIVLITGTVLYVVIRGNSDNSHP